CARHRGRTCPAGAERPNSLLTLRDCADTLTEALRRIHAERIVLVGHSLAGVVLPLAASRLPDRIHHLVFLSATVPCPGTSVADTLPPGAKTLLRLWARQRDTLTAAVGEIGRSFGHRAEPIPLACQ